MPKARPTIKAINELRNRQKRNMLATLLFSQGTPMMLGGDEFGRTQHGNNNAYCQDSDISWFDWELGDDANGLLAFTKRLIKLRQSYPALRRSRFLTGQLDEALGVKRRDLDQCQRRGDAGRELEGCVNEMLRHAAGRPRAEDRHQAARRGQDRSDRHEQLRRTLSILHSRNPRVAEAGHYWWTPKFLI